jgi:hypothetical protein
MNLTFNYFKNVFPEKKKFRSLTAEELDFFRGHFPEDLVSFLEEEGYCSYGDGFFHFVNPKDYEKVLSEWKQVPAGHLVFCRTGMGNLITWNGDQVCILHVYSGYFSDISESMFDFFKFSLGDTQFVEKTLFKKLFDEAKNRLGELEEDECYAFVPALALGGNETAENLHKMKINESMNLLSQLQH